MTMGGQPAKSKLQRVSIFSQEATANWLITVFSVMKGQHRQTKMLKVDGMSINKVMVSTNMSGNQFFFKITYDVQLLTHVSNDRKC